jgi:hypothetical protein
MTAMFSTVTGKKSALTAEVIAATERAETLLLLWRELRRLDHRVRLARLKFEMIRRPRPSRLVNGTTWRWGQK